MTFRDSHEGQTHWACEDRLKKEGGKAKCCSCNPHDNCSKNNPMKPLEQIEKDFWMFWGESPEGTPKRKKGEAVLGFIRQAIEKFKAEEETKWRKILNSGKKMYEIGRQDERERIEKIIKDEEWIVKEVKGEKEFSAFGESERDFIRDVLIALIRKK